MKNGLTTSLLLFFFLIMSKIWAGGTMLNGIKKGDGLTCYVNTGLPEFYFHCSLLECIYIQRMSSQNSPLFSNITTNLN